MNRKFCKIFIFHSIWFANFQLNLISIRIYISAYLYFLSYLCCFLIWVNALWFIFRHHSFKQALTFTCNLKYSFALVISFHYCMASRIISAVDIIRRIQVRMPFYKKKYPDGLKLPEKDEMSQVETGVHSKICMKCLPLPPTGDSFSWMLLFPVGLTAKKYVGANWTKFNN